MKIACLLTVCAVLSSTLCAGNASHQLGETVKDRVSLEATNTSIASNESTSVVEDLSLTQPFDLEAHAPLTRKARKIHHSHHSSRRQDSHGFNHDRAIRQFRKLSVRSAPVSRSLDVSQNQIETIQAPETFEDGAIHIEPLYRVTKKKGIWESLVEIFRRVVNPPKAHLGPLIGPIHFPGVGDKVYIRLLEPPESNHLVIKVVSHEHPDIEVSPPSHFSSGTTVLKSPEVLTQIDHHSPSLSSDTFSSHGSSVLSSEVLSSLHAASDQYHVHSPGLMSHDSLSSPSSQYRHVKHSSPAVAKDVHSSSQNHYQMHSQVHLSPDSISSASNQYRHLHPTMTLSEVPHSSSNNVMKIPKPSPTTMKQLEGSYPKGSMKNPLHTSRNFRLNYKPGDSKYPVLPSVGPTTNNVHTAMRQHEMHQQATKNEQSFASPPVKLTSNEKENREPIHPSIKYDESSFRPYYAEHYHHKPTPNVRFEEFNTNDAIKPKPTETSKPLNPIFAEVPSSAATRVNRVVTRSSTPKPISTEGAFEVVKAPVLSTTYLPLAPQYVLPYKPIEASPTKFNLLSTVATPKSSTWNEKSLKRKSTNVVSSNNTQPTKISIPRAVNDSWESTKMLPIGQVKTVVNRGTKEDLHNSTRNIQALETFVKIISTPQTIPLVVKVSPTIPTNNPVNIPFSNSTNSPPHTSTNIPFQVPSYIPIHVTSNIPTSPPTKNPVPSSAPLKVQLKLPTSVPANSQAKSSQNVGKKQQTTNGAKCVKCQEQKEKKVAIVVERPQKTEPYSLEHSNPVTVGNVTPAARVPSTTTTTTITTTTTTTVASVPAINTVNKSPITHAAKLSMLKPTKSPVRVTSSTTKKSIVGYNKRRPMVSNTTKRSIMKHTTKKTFVTSSTTSTPPTTEAARKSRLQASDFKKRLDLWKKNSGNRKI